MKEKLRQIFAGRQGMDELSKLLFWAAIVLFVVSALLGGAFGALADFGSHMMDICDYLLRDSCGPIAEITCMQSTCMEEREIIGKPGRLGPVTNDDVACWICRTEGGTLYNFTASRIGATFMLEIVGEGGKMIFHGDRPFELTLQLKDKNGPYTEKPQAVQVPEHQVGRKCKT